MFLLFMNAAWQAIVWFLAVVWNLLRSKDYEAILRTQAVLLSQGNSLGWVAKEYPGKDRFDNLKTIVLGLTRQMISFDDLAFLGRSSDPQLIIELDVANESYDHFRRLIEARNKGIEEFFQDSGTEIREFDRETGQIRAMGSQRLMFNMRQANETLSKALHHAKQVNEATAQRLLSFARKEFPGQQIPYATAGARTLEAAG
jgi:hypothetical protein